MTVQCTVSSKYTIKALPTKHAPVMGAYQLQWSLNTDAAADHTSLAHPVPMCVLVITTKMWGLYWPFYTATVIENIYF